jgi:hypothetical protein
MNNCMEWRARAVPLLRLAPLLRFLRVKAATEATTTKPNLTSMTHHSAGSNRLESRGRELLLIEENEKAELEQVQPRRLSSLHFSAQRRDGLEEQLGACES